MKKMVWAAAVILCLASCGSNDQYKNHARAVGRADIDLSTDLASEGLLGTVRRVKNSDGTELRFTEKGMKRNYGLLRRDVLGRKRLDLTSDGVAALTFDEIGRLVSLEIKDKGLTETFEYREDAYYPIRKISVVLDSLGKETERKTVDYVYDKEQFDEYGNWLMRTENGDTVTRKITYYPDPYRLETDVTYSSAKEVAKAYYEGMVEEDAEKELSTFEYALRKKGHMQKEGRDQYYNDLKVDKSNIVSFSIKGTENIKVDGKNMTAVKVKVRLANGRERIQVIHCYQNERKEWYRDRFMMEE